MIAPLFSPKVNNRIGIGLLMLADVAALFGIFFFAVFFRRSVIPALYSGAPEFLFEFGMYLWLFPVWMFVLVYEGAYTKRFTFWDEVRFLWKCAFIASLTILTILFIGKQSESVSRTMIITMSLSSMLFLPVIRISIKRLIYRMGFLKRKILIIGAGSAGRNALNALRREPELGYEVAGIIDESDSRVRSINGVGVHRGIDRVDRYIRKAGIHDVLIAKPELDRDRLVRIINTLQHKAENILYVPDLSGIAVLGTELRHFFHDQAIVIEIRNNLAKPVNYIAKRSFDYFVGVVFFVVLIVPIVIISLLIRLSSRGPAIFVQERVGKKFKTFMCYKFRTMYADAEQRLKEILDADPTARAEWNEYRKLSKDPRVTPLGAFLRRTSLDELPQIFNILKGEMSLVGPRPVTREEIDIHYKDAAKLCFSVPPGLTGLWQVSGRSDSSYEQRVAMDSWYVRNWNLWLDIVIIFKTVKVVILREGAR